MFWKKYPKIKKPFPLKTTFYNFALKIETIWAKKVVKPILEAWNAVNDVIVYVWFIYSLILKKFLKSLSFKVLKVFKNMQYNKE